MDDSCRGISVVEIYINSDSSPMYREFYEHYGARGVHSEFYLFEQGFNRPITPYKWVERTQNKTDKPQLNVWYIIRLRTCQNAVLGVLFPSRDPLMSTRFMLRTETLMQRSSIPALLTWGYKDLYPVEHAAPS